MYFDWKKKPIFHIDITFRYATFAVFLLSISEVFYLVYIFDNPVRGAHERTLLVSVGIYQMLSTQGYWWVVGSRYVIFVSLIFLLFSSLFIFLFRFLIRFNEEIFNFMNFTHSLIVCLFYAITSIERTINVVCVEMKCCVKSKHRYISISFFFFNYRLQPMYL